MFSSTMAVPVRMRFGDVPLRYLFNFFSTVQSLSILLDNSESVSRQVLQELGFLETEINYMYDRYRRPVSEALHIWQGTVRDLYRVLMRIGQREALKKLLTSLYDNVDYVRRGEPLPRNNWDALLNSTSYRISPNVSWPRFYIRTYIIPIWNRILGFIYMLFPFNTSYASDMYRAISNVINNINFIIWCLTIAQNASAIYSEGRLHNLVAIFISVSLWMKLYLMNQPLNQLKELLPCGNDGQKVRRADFLYKEIRIALLFVFVFKLALATIGCALFYAYPQFLLKDLQSQMTQFVMFLFAFELAHNAFYLIAFYRDPNIFRIINKLFPNNQHM